MYSTHNETLQICTVQKHPDLIKKYLQTHRITLPKHGATTDAFVMRRKKKLIIDSVSLQQMKANFEREKVCIKSIYRFAVNYLIFFLNRTLLLKVLHSVSAQVISNNDVHSLMSCM